MIAGDEHKARSILRASGLLMVVPEAVPRVAELTERPSLVPAVSLIGLLAFAALFLMTTVHPLVPRRGALPLLAAQTVIVFGIILTSGPRFDAALLTVVAAQLPIALSLRAAVVWVAAQTVAMTVAYVVLHGAGGPRDSLLPQILFQVFGLAAAFLLRRIEDDRTAIAQVNAELLATRSLLEDTSRALERVRISRELHDGLGHALTALGLKLETARLRAPAEMAPLMAELSGFARRVHQEVAVAVGELRVEPTLDLARALRSLVDGVDAPKIHLAVDEQLPRLTPAAIHVLFRSIQEAVTNTVRHSGAQNLWIECRAEHGGVEVHARDDGRGMQGALVEGNGLRGMRERLGELGGSLALLPAEPGLSMRIKVPAATALQEALR